MEPMTVHNFQGGRIWQQQEAQDHLMEDPHRRLHGDTDDQHHQEICTRKVLERVAVAAALVEEMQVLPIAKMSTTDLIKVKECMKAIVLIKTKDITLEIDPIKTTESIKVAQLVARLILRTIETMKILIVVIAMIIEAVIQQVLEVMIMVLVTKTTINLHVVVIAQATLQNLVVAIIIKTKDTLVRNVKAATGTTTMKMILCRLVVVTIITKISIKILIKTKMPTTALPIINICERRDPFGISSANGY
jgi:hypothetical protein